MNASTSPIFIGGLSHSGKTPLRVALSAHPDLAMTRRTHLWDRWYGQLGDLRDPVALRGAVTAMSRDPGIGALAPDVDRICREFAAGDPTYGQLFTLIHQHAAEREGKRRWGDQVGFVERYADTVFADFPAARMVHMVRDPRDRIAEVLGDRDGRPGQLGWETAKWRRSARLALRNRRRHGDRYLVVPYEALRSDPPGTVDRVCAFVDEVVSAPMDDAIAGLRFDHSVASPGVDEFVESHVARELETLGYAPRRPSRATTSRGVRAFDRAGMTAWNLFADRPLTRMEP
jgi:hypothetical protein